MDKFIFDQNGESSTRPVHSNLTIKTTRDTISGVWDQIDLPPVHALRLNQADLFNFTTVDGSERKSSTFTSANEKSKANTGVVVSGLT